MSHAPLPISKRLTPPVDPTRDHISGPENAPVTLVEYGDYQCGYCRRAHAGVLRVRDERLAGQVRYVFRHLPNRRQHQYAQQAAEAAEAAAAQGKFWEMHDYLLTHQQALDRAGLERAARELGLDLQQFTRDLDEHVYESRVNEDVASAEYSGATATPTFYVDGLRYDGPWDQESLVEAARKPLGWRIRLLAGHFAGLSTTSGILMLIGVVLALVWANSPWREGYHALWETHLAIGLGEAALNFTLHQWVNDGLIVLFFLVVALEIRRELTDGDLASPRRAALPVAAAVGGMLVPVFLYLAFNMGGPHESGWGVPMGTDTAFALGILALLGRRAPLALRVFIAAAAIADDVGAILVIALFYSTSVSLPALGAAALCFLVLVGLNRARVFALAPYVAIGLLLWFAVFQSGVHPTLAGVLLAFVIPTRAPPLANVLLAQAESIMKNVEAPAIGEHSEGRYQAAVRALEEMVERLLSPAQRMARNLQPWSANLVLPVFAFANAGVELDVSLREFLEPVSLGVLLGLVVGKPVGITGGAWIAAKSGLAQSPTDFKWPQLGAAGMLCGIGFTMSFFIASMAFKDEHVLALAKLSVLVASVIAGVAGWLVFAALHVKLERRATARSQ